MTRLLIVLPMPDWVRAQLQTRLAAALPELHIDIVDHPDKADQHIGAAEILMAYHIPDRLAAGADRLKWVQSLGTGVDNFLGLKSLRRDIMLTRMHGIHGAPGSEAALGLMFALSRNLPATIRNQDRKIWDRDGRASARLLSRQTVGILGVGQIAESLAPKCQALGMKVVGIASARRQVAGFDRIHPRDELLDVIGSFDHLVVLVPLTAETRHIVNRDLLAAMHRDSFVINLARGPVVDEEALIEALNRGTIRGAGLDVFAVEPLPKESPLWSMANVIITPHAAGMHDAYIEDLMPILAHNLKAFVQGRPDEMLHRVVR